MEIFFENFLHFSSFCVLENFFIQIFSIFPQKLDHLTKTYMLLGEFCGLMALFFIGSSFSIFCNKVKILQKEIKKYKILKMPYFIALSPIFIFGMPSCVFMFFCGYLKKSFNLKYSIFLLFFIRFFVNLFGFFV